MPESLVASIFGSADDGKAASTLFSSIEDLPARPHHEPVARRIRKESDTLQEDNDESPPKKKKRRKEKKTEPTEDSNQEAAEEATPKDEKEECTIFVGNLPLESTTRKSLAKLFADCGPIVSTRLRSIPTGGVKLPPSQKGNQALVKKVAANLHVPYSEDKTKSTVQGYVVFAQKESVEKALQKNHTLVVEGHKIRVDTATPTVDPSRSVFCGNLPYGADESSLQEHFEKQCDFDRGDVQGVRIVRDKESYQCKGFGYVLLRDKTLVPTALQVHGTTYMKRELRVLVCGKRFKGKQGANNKKKMDENLTPGAFRRILEKQAEDTKKRKRGDKMNFKKNSANSGGLSRRAAVEKKTEKRVKKIQKRINKGMGKTKKR